MAWLEGLISGYSGSLDEQRKENLRVAEEANERESRLYEALLNSDDPQIRAMAGTGLLESSQARTPKRSFMGQWIGKMQGNPTYARLLQYMNTEQPHEVRTYKAGLPSTQRAGNVAPISPTPTPAVPGTAMGPGTSNYLPGEESGWWPEDEIQPPPSQPQQAVTTPPPQAQAAALPETSPTQAGAPAPTPTQSVPPPRPPGAVDAAQTAGALTAPVNTPPGAAPSGPLAQQTVPIPDSTRARTGSTPVAPRIPSDAFGPPKLQTYPSDATFSAATKAPVQPSYREQLVPGPIETTSRTEMRLPQAFPSKVDLAMQQRLGQGRGDYEADVEMFRRAGYPDPERSAAELAVEKSGRGTGSLKKGSLVMMPDGSYGRQWIDGQTGAVVATHPELSARVTSASAANVTEMVAHTLYAQPGETAKMTFDRVQREPGNAAKMANILKRQQYYIAEAPMNMGQQFEATRKLQDDWSAYSKDHRTMVNQLQIMRQSWKAMNEGKPFIPPASEAIIITFERMLDPTSVVRETEARRPGSMQPWLDQIRTWQQNIKDGGANISIENLKPYIALAERIVAESERHMAAERGRIQADADRYGLGQLNLLGFQPLPPASDIYGVQGTTLNTNPPPPAPPAAPGAGVKIDTTLPPHLRELIDPATGNFR